MIISKTPLRMSFFGGGTDFADYYKNSRYGAGQAKRIHQGLRQGVLVGVGYGALRVSS